MLEIELQSQKKTDEINRMSSVNQCQKLQLDDQSKKFNVLQE